MNANRIIIKLGISLFIITMALFFLLLYLFSTQGRISEAQYFNYSAMINSFALPVLYAAFGFYAIYSVAKVRTLTFWQTWQLSFFPMFIGGLLSLSSIFIFFNTSGQWAQDSFQRGWYDMATANPNPEFMEKNGELINAMANLDNNLFSFKLFLLAFSLILFFYILISIIFASFFNNKRI